MRGNSTGRLAITFPSLPAAILTGSIVMPLYMLGADAIQNGFAEQEALRSILFLMWGIFGFFVPVMYSTMDMAYVRRSMRRPWAVMFRPYTAPKAESDFKSFHSIYIPMVKRMAALFVSVVISSLILQSIGVDF